MLPASLRPGTSPEASKDVLLYRTLQAARLEQYAYALAQVSIKTVKDLQDASDDILTAVGLTDFEKKRLRQKLKTSQQRKNDDGGGGGGGGDHPNRNANTERPATTLPKLVSSETFTVRRGANARNNFKARQAFQRAAYASRHALGLVHLTHGERTRRADALDGHHEETGCDEKRNALSTIDKSEASGAAEALVATMKRYSEQAPVQERALFAVVNLSSNRADMKTRLCACGAADAVVVAMRRHSERKVLQEAACHVLANLS